MIAPMPLQIPALAAGEGATPGTGNRPVDQQQTPPNVEAVLRRAQKSKSLQIIRFFPQ